MTYSRRASNFGLSEACCVTVQKWTLKEALEFVTAARPGASPNAGFMARLLELDEKLYGRQTVKVSPPFPCNTYR